MKVKNGDVFVALTEQDDGEGGKTKSPLKQLIDIGFPIKTSYQLAKMAHKLDSQFKIINEVKDGLLFKHGEKNDDGMININPTHKNWGKFIEEFNELLETEVELGMEKVQIPEKIGDKDIEVSANILINLDQFVKV